MKLGFTDAYLRFNKIEAVLTKLKLRNIVATFHHLTLFSLNRYEMRVFDTNLGNFDEKFR